MAVACDLEEESLEAATADWSIALTPDANIPMPQCAEGRPYFWYRTLRARCPSRAARLFNKDAATTERNPAEIDEVLDLVAESIC